MTYLIWIVALLVLILVHELGHFSVARLVGAKATRFLVGFPPVALSFRRGETEYGIGMIPLGGYVRIVGMNRPLPDDTIVCQDAIEEIDLRRPEGQRDLRLRKRPRRSSARRLPIGPSSRSMPISTCCTRRRTRRRARTSSGFAMTSIDAPTGGYRSGSASRLFSPAPVRTCSRRL